jgi:hypothetical protein
MSLPGEFLADAALLVLDALALRWAGRPWPVCLIPGGLFFLSDTPLLTGHPPSLVVRGSASAAYFVALIWPDNDQCKRLWGKIRSAGLTVVNAARFQQQVKEAR